MFEFLRSNKMLQLEADVQSLRTQLSQAREPAIRNEEIKLTDIEELRDLFGITNTLSGASVNSKTSMKVSIVWACTRLLAGAIAQMPLHVYLEGPAGRQRDVNHAYSTLLNLQPCPAFSGATMWEYLTMSMLLEGDGFALIDRVGAEVVGLIPINPKSVTVELRRGRLEYFFTLDNTFLGVDQDDMLHLPGFGFNGLRSMSVIQWGARESIGSNMAMEQYVGEFFAGGAHQDVVMFKEGKWDQKQKDQARRNFADKYGGGGKRKLPMVLDQMVKLQELTIKAADAQLLELKELSVTDIARAFGIPSFLVNQEQKNSSWGTGVSQIALAFIRFTLQPHLVRFQQEVNRKLFMRSNSFAEFYTAALQRGTIEERNKAYREAVGGSQGPGWLTQNEVRRMENLPKLDDPKYDELYDPGTAKLPAGETNA